MSALAKHPTALVVLAIATVVAGALASIPAEAQQAPSGQCFPVNPLVERCEGGVCAVLWGTCEMDYDGDAIPERHAELYRLPGTAISDFGDTGERHCFQQDLFKDDPPDGEPEFDNWG